MAALGWDIGWGGLFGFVRLGYRVGGVCLVEFGGDIEQGGLFGCIRLGYRVGGFVWLR